MRRKVASLTFVVLLGWVSAGRADFKYTEQSKVTGGMMAGMLKFAGAFSHKANQPVSTTHYVKGNRMRTENSTSNTAEIIDLDGRRMISIDNQKRTYSIVTFDQIKAAMENAQQQMKAKQQKGQNVQMTMTPKVEVTPTQNTRTILGQSAHEVKVKMEMQMQATDTEKHPSGSGSMTFTNDMWVAPGVPGYEQVRDFYKRMAQSMDAMAMARMFNTGMNPQMAQGMEEMRKNASSLQGLPLVEYVSMYMNGMTGQPGAQSGQQGQEAQGGSSSQGSQPAVENPGAALAKGLGGLMGGFGRKKKQQDESQNSSQTASTQAPPPPASSGSLMDMTMEVTSYSSDPVPENVFEIPAGYTQVQSDLEKQFGQKR